MCEAMFRLGTCAIAGDWELRDLWDQAQSELQQGSTEGSSARPERGKMKKAAEAATSALFCPCGEKVDLPVTL
jgi:hypothetical protein